DDRVRLALADEIVDDLTSGMGTLCDPEDFAPFLGPVAAERWVYLRRIRRPPEPGAEELLEALGRPNPTRLQGDVNGEYGRVAEYLPSHLDRFDTFAKMRRGLWFHTRDYIPPDLVGPEDRFDAIAQELWQQRMQS